MTLPSGTRLGPYEVLAPIGAGGMGEVYRAHDPRLGRDVAIKVLPRVFAEDADRLRRFEQEARAAGALNHPNILAVFDIGSHEGSPFLVMELLSGQNLAERLRAGALPVESALDLAMQVAQGLAAAHQQGIVHRDLKPANLFITTGERVKILDFGLAKQLPSAATESQTELPTQDIAAGTEAGVLLGTVGYMSPEQARGEPTDTRSDIFSLGCVLYEMLTGEPPFKRNSVVETLSAILRDDPAALVATRGTVSPSLDRIVKRCLEKRPEDRFPSAPDLALALNAAAGSLRTGQPVVEAPAKSIVVLPFENLSSDPENAYFADGLTEELIADLSKVRALRVISRTSAMHYRGTTKPLPAIARELNVRYVLEGSVRRAGNNLRITAQLIEAATDGHVWAEKYTGTVDDAFDIQEKVSRAIVEALKVELTPQESRRLADRPIENAHALECYLKARREIWRFDAPSLDRAMEHLEEGLRVEPDNPLLLAGVGYVHIQRVNIGVGQEESLEKAEAFASRAIYLAPELPQGHLVLGLTAIFRVMTKAAIEHFRHALAAEPNNPDALRWLGMFCAYLGKSHEALALSERAIAIDPMAPRMFIPLAYCHWLDGRFEAALAVLEHAGSINPDDPSTKLVRASGVPLLFYLGRDDEAIALVESVAKDEKPTIFSRLAVLWRYAFSGDRQKVLSLMTPELVQICQRDYQYSCDLACVYAKLGDADSALNWLLNAVELGFLNHRYLGEIDPVLAPLRGDPRFQALMARAREKQAELEAGP
jgi:non-specific serine/threonine protein kinase